MASIATQVGNWINGATEKELNDFDRAYVAWNNPGIRTMGAFIDAAQKNPAIGDLLPESLKKLLGLQEDGSRNSEVAA